jgi:hypothetical protein
MSCTETLKTRVTPETKARVLAITRTELLTEAVWLRRLVTRSLQASPAHSAQLGELGDQRGGLVPPARGVSTKDQGQAARLYVRLRREDHLLLQERATARAMAPATYVSVLVRAHLRTLVPLPKDELAALKRAIAELGAVGRNLNQITRAVNQGTRIDDPAGREFRAMLKICVALRDHTKDLIKANTASWASGYVEKTV